MNEFICILRFSDSEVFAKTGAPQVAVRSQYKGGVKHHCYGSHDLVTRCLSILEARDVLTAEAQAAYRSHIFPGFHSVGNGGR